MNPNDMIVDQEVRIRFLEKIAGQIDDRFDKIEVEMKADKHHLLAKMDSNFHWILGTILAQIAMTITLFGGIILHMAKLI